jgi:hypothetical protein
VRCSASVGMLLTSARRARDRSSVAASAAISAARREEETSDEHRVNVARPSLAISRVIEHAASVGPDAPRD